MCSPFFARLADRMLANGHRLLKVNFNAGDWAYWAPRSCWHFRGRPESLRDFLDDKYRKFGITDQILFGDRRPVHRPAVEHAAVGGVRTHVYEEGYFRPYWVTLERRGLNGHSLLPRDPDWFREVGGRLPDPPQPVGFHSPFRTPQHSRPNTRKMENTFGLHLPHWQSGVARILTEIFERQSCPNVKASFWLVDPAHGSIP